MKITDVKKTEIMKNPYGLIAKKIYETAHAQVIHIELEPGQYLQKHITAVDMFFYVLKGSGVVEIGDEKRTAGEDTIIESNAGTPHCWYNESDKSLQILAVRVPATDIPPVFV